MEYHLLNAFPMYQETQEALPLALLPAKMVNNGICLGQRMPIVYLLQKVIRLIYYNLDPLHVELLFMRTSSITKVESTIIQVEAK